MSYIVVEILFFCDIILLVISAEEVMIRYIIPPTALTNNLATALRAVFFHISTHIRVQAPCYCGYMKKQPHGCLQGCFFVGAGGRTRTDTDD